MKKLMVTIILCAGLIIMPTQKSHAFVWEVIRKAAVKVIKAIDLQIQRQQNKVIWLQNAQKKLENTMSKARLNEITDWVDKQKKLYADYYEELRKVKAILAYYHRIKDVISKQLQLVDEYKRAWNLVKQDKNFTAGELDYIAKVYSGILDQSVKNIDQLYFVINSFQTQMTDAKRLEIINEVSDRVEGNYTDLQRFNRQNVMLSLQRSKAQNEVDAVKKLYGLQ